MSAYLGSDKVTPIIEVGGGSSGYKVYFKCIGSDDYGYCRINDSTDYDFKCTGVTLRSQSASMMILPTEGVNKIKFYGFSHASTYPSYGASWIRWRPHASDWLTWTGDSGSDMVIGTEYTLTQDIDILASYATCLSGDTLITMADGSQRRLDQIYIDDMVMGYEGPVKVTYCDSDCKKYHDSYHVWIFDDGTVIKTIHPHRFYNADREKFIYMEHETQEHWEIGEHALNRKGEEIKLVAHLQVEDRIRHYTLFTDGSNTYYANGLLSGNRNSVIQ